MLIFLTFVAWVSSVAVLYRLRKYFVTQTQKPVSKFLFPKVSVIIAARNEETNIGALLSSLSQSITPFFEIIVVDDNSNDNTRAVAGKFNVKILRAGSRPEGWAGKNWACHVGSQAASGDYFLFTDADTIHQRDGSLRAMRYLITHNADMLSAPSFHRNKLWWEKFLGPFHCLVHCGASPFDKQSPQHVYAVGQYILIKRDVYEVCGGHFAVRSEVAEDVALAKQIIAHRFDYVAYAENTLYTVQMYPAFSAFCQGWIRLLRLGMRQLSFRISFNALLPLLAMNFWNLYPPSLLAYIPLVLTLFCFGIVQRKLGSFSVVGVLFFPISVLLFLVLSCSAIAQELRNMPIAWKGRTYSGRDKIVAD
jgi:4,4'-diaponeurosporenoate glycosyltransferase